MYAVIETGGKQYKVENGDVLYIEKLAAEDEAAVEFPVVAVCGEEGLKVGAPYVENAKVSGKVLKSGKGKKITVAGGGGAATAIQVQCALDGAREISIFNIKDAFFERTLKTAEKIRAAVPSCVVNVYDIADTARMTAEIASSDIFANATIVGMKPMENESVVKDTSAFRPGLVVADAVYNPEETRLLREAKEAGAICIGGKGMLLWQGVAAFKLYTGKDMPVEEVKERFFR